MRGSCLETSVLSLCTVVFLETSVSSLVMWYSPTCIYPYLRLEMERTILQNINRDHTYVVLCKKVA